MRALVNISASLILSRIFAFLIDTFIVILLIFIISGLKLTVVFFDIRKIVETLYWIRISMLIYLLYFILMEGFFNTTIGKYVFRLRVVSCDGEEMGIYKAFIRNVLRFIDGIILYIPVFIWWRRLGDMGSGTVVIKVGDIERPEVIKLTKSMYDSLILERNRALEELKKDKSKFEEVIEIEDFLASSEISDEIDPLSLSKYYKIASKYGIRWTLAN